jgi:uncharacterized protein
VREELVAPMVEHLHGFLRDLTDRGLPVPMQKKGHFLQAVGECAPANPGLVDLYWIGRATLTTSPADLAVFDAVFATWFTGGPAAALVEPDPAPAQDEQPGPTPGSGEDVAEDAADAGSGLGGSSATWPGRLRVRASTPEERDLVARIRRELPAAIPRVPARRLRSGNQPVVLDLRRVVRDASRSYGEVLRLRWRHPPARRRRVLVLIDVSGSMKEHSADLIRFAHAAVTSGERVEVFTAGTRLTHATPALRAEDVDDAVAALSAAVLDAEGGTRLGGALQELLSHPRYVTMARGAVVVVFSDGFERGDIAPLVAAVRRLRLLGHRLLWWSPLAGDPTYRPETRAMAAILPDLHVLAGVRTLAEAREQVLLTLGDRTGRTPAPRTAVPADREGPRRRV